MNTFIPLYESLFEVKIAETDSEIKAVQNLRYQVYVEERQWEPENETQLERDTYDSQSIHLLLIFKPENIPIGTARIILSNPSNIHRSYPVQEVCNHPMFWDRSWVRQHPEFSRFAIPKKRREYCLSHPLVLEAISNCGGDEKKTLFNLAMGLSFGLITKMAEVLRFKHFDGTCAVLEKSLLRLLSKNGLRVTPLGKPVEHHGVRQPCYIEVNCLENLVSNPDTLLGQMIYRYCLNQEDVKRIVNI